MELLNHKAKASFYRGLVLDHFIVLELSIEERIAEQFVEPDEKKQMLKSVLLNCMTFESKKRAIQYFLFKEDEKAGFIKTKSNSRPCKQILSELDHLQTIRNKFAHYWEVKPTNPDHVIYLADFSTRNESEGFTHDQITEITERLFLLRTLIQDYLGGSKSE